MMIPPPHPPVELTWAEADEITGLLSDAYRRTALASDGDDLAARLLRAVEFLISRRLSARFLVTGAGQ